MVAKTNYSKVLAFKHGIALVVGSLLAFVNFTVNFYNQGRSMTVEINNVPVDYLLAPKVPSAEFVCPQVLPKDFFGLGHVAAEFLRKSELLLADHLSTNDVSLCHKISRIPPSLKGKGEGVRFSSQTFQSTH